MRGGDGVSVRTVLFGASVLALLIFTLLLMWCSHSSTVAWLLLLRQFCSPWVIPYGRFHALD